MAELTRSCRARCDEFDAFPGTDEHGLTVFRFPALPPVGVIVDLEWLDGAARLSVEVPDPNGPLRCGSLGCPTCDPHREPSHG